MKSASSSPRRWLPFACGLLCLAGALSLLLIAGRTVGIDTYYFWAGVPFARGAGAKFYAADEAPRLLARLPAPRSPLEAAARAYWRRFDGSPPPFFWAALRGPLAGDYESALRRWQAISIASLLVGVALLGRAAGMSPLGWSGLVAFSGLACLPVIQDLGAGNVNAVLLLAGALWVTFGASRRPAVVAAGDVVLGLSLAFKPLLVIAPVLVVVHALAAGDFRRALRRAAGIGAGVAAGVVVGAAYMGTLAAWRGWVGRVAAVSFGGGNVSLLRLAGRIDLGWRAALLAVAVGVALTATMARSRTVAPAAATSAAAPPELRLLALGGVLVLLSSPLVWVHYYVQALPAVALALRPRWRQRWRELLPLVPAVLAVAFVPRHLGLLHPRPSAVLAAGGLFVLLAWLARDGLRDRGPLAVAGEPASPQPGRAAADASQPAAQVTPPPP